MRTLKIDFSRFVTKLIRKIAKREGREETEIIRRALNLYSYLDEEIAADDGRFLAIVSRDGKILTKLQW